MEEEMIEHEAPEVEAPAEEMEPGDAFMQLLAELQERYQIADEDMNAVVDAFNVCMGDGEEETWTCPKCGMEVPASETVCPECGYSIEGEGSSEENEELPE